jgi:hypothetical protein
MLIRTKYKKYVDGGTANPLPYGQIGNFLGEGYDMLTPTNQYGAKSDGNAAISGALKMGGQGAAIGTMIMPGIGTAIGGVLGAGIGAFTGKKKNDQLQENQANANTLFAQMQQQQYNQRFRNYDSTGSNQNQVYAKLGGQVPISHTLGIGGKLDKLSENRYEVDGRSHDEGGVKFPNEQVELEGGESGSGDYIFSKELGFADKHIPIAKMIGKMDKKPTNRITAQTIEHLEQREQQLKQRQEEVKSYLPDSITQMVFGGKLNKKVC